MRCLECNKEVDQVDNQHLSKCCGLTLQEYAIRNHKSLDLLVNESMIDAPDLIADYTLPADKPSARSRTIFSTLMWLDAFQQKQDFFVLDGEIRQLDQLLWYLRELQVYGFQYRQEYLYSDSHRVIATNRIKTLHSYRHKFPKNEENIDFELFVAVVVAQVGEFHNGYIFLSLPEDSEKTHWLVNELVQKHQIRWVKLESYDGYGRSLYRTESLQDAQRLLKLVQRYLQEIPCVCDRFYSDVESAVVNKELVFDSAHFITDHPDKCQNLHGGRYTLNVKVKGRIDPLTGFVIDYGYLKSVVKNRVIDRLDHQTLNYIHADLGWRSSTEAAEYIYLGTVD